MGDVIICVHVRSQIYTFVQRNLWELEAVKKGPASRNGLAAERVQSRAMRYRRHSLDKSTRDMITIIIEG